MNEKNNKLLRFSEMIHEANQKFNITGLKTREEIYEELIMGSINPLQNINVPHGTRFIDLGSGAGVPGIALAINFEELSGILIESNAKKAAFIQSVVNELKLSELQVVCGRAEELAFNPLHREKYDWCFIRALGKLFIMLELGAPFVKEKGSLYIYSNITPGEMPEKELEHARKLGLDLMSHKQNSMEIPVLGLCLIKNSKTPGRYPRKFAIIKRDAAAN